MKNTKGFTLIEIIIAISILAVIFMASYAPYNYYQNKAKLKNTAGKIAQILYNSRNMAMNGIVGVDGNVSVGVFFNNSDNNKINVYSFPYNIDENNISYIESSDIKKIKTLYLDRGIQIDKIGGKDNLLFFFKSITGEVKYYTWNGVTRNILTGNEIEIDISYKGSSSPNLNKKISYFTNTNIVDY